MWNMLRGLLVLTLLATAARAETVTVAAAANFRKPLDEIAARFEDATGHEVVVSAGSSGQLYAQIANGAPFDVFLSADQARPAQAIEAGLAVPGSQRTYAVGRLILIFRDAEAAGRIGMPPDLSQVRTLAIANPATAPYGAAAMQVIGKLGGADALAGRIAEAQNVSGVNAAVQTGAAEAGFAALASVSGPGAPEPQGWPVPADLHDPIRQDAVLLGRGRDNPAATAFLDYLFGDEAARVIRGYGYDLP
jgi:molybdate transport system substrate-binding protein